MEIYDFINSKDIKTHWKNINYVPTAVESAWLIWQSKDHTLEEKHAVWQNILDNSEDCLIPKGRFNLLPRWLHPFLREYMKIENYLIKEFFREEPNAVYFYRECFEDDERKDWYDESILFCTFGEACAHAKSERDLAPPSFVEFVKIYIGEKGKQLFVRFNLEDEIVRVDERNYLVFETDAEIFQTVFRNMWFSFPTPFKKGDIVKTVLGKYARPTTFADLFVLTSVCTEVDRPMIDGSDMTAYGYFVGSMGEVYYECIHNYMDLEYVHSELCDEERLLIPISRYLKDEIDLVLLLGAQRIMLCENEARNVYGLLNYTKEGKRIAGIET